MHRVFVRVCTHTGRDRELMRWDITVHVWMPLLGRENDEETVTVRNRDGGGWGWGGGC